MSKVACVRVKPETVDPQDVFAAVGRVMELAQWRKYVPGGTVVLKVNAVWDKIYPSCTTTPMVIEGVVRTLLAAKKTRPKKLIIADADTAAIMRVDVSFKIQGIEKMARRCGVGVVNLSQTKFETVVFPQGLVLKSLKVSKVLLDADCIITMPVLKTHAYSQMTGALKNQWGCIHDMRHNYHTVLSQAISDVNLFFKDRVKFAVMDGLFGMEGRGPKTGRPRKVGYIFASADRVALDTAAAMVMGLDPDKISHVNYAQAAGLGSKRYRLVGDKLPMFQFALADRANFVMGAEMATRHLGWDVEKLLFAEHSPFYHVLRWSAKIYYDVWYEWVGVKYVREMMKTNFGKMWEEWYLRD